MKKILVTGGTVFVSKYIAQYYVAKGCQVYVLNRNSRPQAEGVKLIKADRHRIGESLRGLHFDAVIDTAYTPEDVELLLDALGSWKNYILISSSAVYPEYYPRPYKEEMNPAPNQYWGRYGTDKAQAEQALMKRCPDAYILRPPYLYGPMNNVYREAFVFDCALADRKFFLPRDGSMKLQFCHIDDLCRFMDILIENRPSRHIFNTGNRDAVSVREWVELCYRIVGKEAALVNVYEDIPQRNYFCFYDYEYSLDVSAQAEGMPDTKPLADGLAEAFDWYRRNRDQVDRKPYIQFIDTHFFDGSGSSGTRFL